MKSKVIHGFVMFFALVLLTGTANAATQLELPVWTRNYTGAIAEKPVNVYITRINDTLQGYYCYEPCNQHKPMIKLSGSLRGKRLLLEERVQMFSGYWNAEISAREIKGEWTSADKKRHFPIALLYHEPENAPDIDLTLVAEVNEGYDPAQAIDCNNVPAISAIKLYRDGKLIQTLETVSMGACGVFVPEWKDVNFDGYQDLSMVSDVGAGPNIPEQTWLYDPVKQRYVDAPASYQKITSPDVDVEHKQIVSNWVDGCCSHGVNVYRWKGNVIELAERGESYLQPVISKGKMYNCYVIPSYEDGRIIYPLERKNGHLTPPFTLNETCESFYLTTNIRTVIQPEKPGAELEFLEIQWRENKASLGRFCPLVPFIDGDKLSPRLVTDDDVPDTCISRAEYERISQEK